MLSSIPKHSSVPEGLRLIDLILVAGRGLLPHLADVEGYSGQGGHTRACERLATWPRPRRC